MNAGTIPDRGAFGVHLGDEGPRVGELDEEMVFETRAGETMTRSRVIDSTFQVLAPSVTLSPAPGEPGRLPFWRGDGPGRPIELGRALGAFLRRAGRFGEDKARAWRGAEFTRQ